MSMSFDAPNNPFFSTFGQVVERFFASGSQAGDPVVVSRPAEEGRAEGSELVQFMPVEELKQTQEAVDLLRRSLRSGSGGRNLDDLQIHYRDFRTAVKSGNEAMMQDNPFYELTLRIFQLNLVAMANLFGRRLATLAAKVPAPLWSAMPLGEIWLSASGKLDLLGRLLATGHTLFLSLRLLLDGVLFLVSSVTTALAVHDLLSGSMVMSQVSAGLLDGEQLQMVHYLLCGLSGLLLSLVVLDFKVRLLRGMGESGLFFQGLVDAFARKPRWMVLAAFLTLISFKTTYDVVVAMITIKADWAQQSKVVQDQVNLALGVWHQGSASKPVSLHDYHAALEAAIVTIQKNFAMLAEDELQTRGSGRGESTKMGPRYFAKRFILEGGYDPGVRDVVKSFKDNAYARTMDKILRDSKLDLSLSLNDRLALIRGEYELHLAQTDQDVKARLAQLVAMMRLDGGVLEVFQQLFTLDTTRVNAVVQQIIVVMDLHATRFKESADKLQELTSRYLTLVGQLDNAMNSAAATVGKVQSQPVDIPVSTAREELKKVKIDLSNGKSLTELKFFLIGQYGVSAAFALLFVIFVGCVFVDLGGLFLYGGGVARRSALERRGMARRMKQLKEWEDGLVGALVGCLEQADVRWVLSGLTFPDQVLVRNAWFHYVEQVNPLLKDVEEQVAGERVMAWFQGLFVLPQSTEMAGYHARVQVMRGLMSHLTRHVPRLVELIFPGMHLGQGMGGLEFQEYFSTIREGCQHDREVFERELQQMVSGGRQTSLVDTMLETRPGQQARQLSPLHQAWERSMGSWMSKKQSQSIIIGRSRRGGSGADGGVLRKAWMVLVQHGFKPPVPPFAYTRRNWLKEVAFAVPAPKSSGQPVEQSVERMQPPQEDLKPVDPVGQFEMLRPDQPEESFIEETAPQKVDAMEVMVSAFPVKPEASHAFVAPSRPPLVPAFATNARFQLGGGQELMVLVTDVDASTARLRLEQLPLGVEVGTEGNLILITEHGGHYPFLCRVTGMGAGALTVGLVTPDPLFATLYATLPAVEAPPGDGDDLLVEPEEADAGHQVEETVPEVRMDSGWSAHTLLTEEMVMDAATEAIRTGCQEIGGLLWKIQIRGLELRKIRPSPVQWLRILNSHRTFLEQTPRVVDDILARLEMVLAADAPLPAEGKMTYLSRLAGESGDLLDQVRSLVDSLEDPIEREKRAVVAREAAERVARKEGADRPDQTVVDQSSRLYRLALQPASGGFFAGIAGDLTRNGLRMVADEVFDSVKPRTRGLLKWIAHPEMAGFSVEVVRIAQNEALLRVVEDQERFERLAHAGRFGNLVCEQWDL